MYLMLLDIVLNTNAEIDFSVYWAGLSRPLVLFANWPGSPRLSGLFLIMYK
jgi:hypothetical protein